VRFPANHRHALAAGIAALSLVVSASALDAQAARQAMLPAGTLRGPAHRLHQYPSVSLATRSQRAAAEEFVTNLAARTALWRDPRRAATAGFRTTRPRRRAGDRSILWFHAEHRAYHHDNVYLDAQRPDTLIYADVPGRRLVLVGVMFSMRRGMRGPHPGGPITRWHWHLVCMTGSGRGLTPRRNGSCPRGSRLRRGSEMMHIWFTPDLRSAYAIHAPVHELCLARYLPAGRCDHAHH
jgi:hypothetical protein